ncbi:MAG TPA: N-acetyl-gamma-glutamyl-phosphate reductase [Phycisphaerae bacterium]|nr:N-acetyl-gamma-glutamyl-phosphate reductase [Phycisphaerae bacterium]
MSIKAVLIGGSGYTGRETLRWLARHGHVEVVGIFGSSNIGPIADIHPILAKQVKMAQQPYSPDTVAALKPDVALLCVPHQIAMSYVPQLLAKGVKIIDWSADYRIRNAAVYEKWYCEHTDKTSLAHAVYGLPELYRNQIKTAKLVANPGCYPTCSILALAPLLRAGLIESENIFISAVSGVTGAGRKATLENHYPERNENFEPYKVGNHRHTPEIEQILGEVADKPANVLFQPHLCPMDQGMMCTICATPTAAVKDDSQLVDVMKNAYDAEPFVRVRTDTLPATKNVMNTNFCDVAVKLAKGRVLIFSTIDNLLKGASTQAIQNLNVMFGLDETTGLY